MLLENSNGKLMISKETIENLVESVAKDFKEAESITTRVELDKENNVSIFANLVVSADAVIKDLSADLQNKIKERVKLATDLEVKEVNITVKKVAQVQEKRSNIIYNIKKIPRYVQKQNSRVNKTRTKTLK